MKTSMLYIVCVLIVVSVCVGYKIPRAAYYFQLEYIVYAGGDWESPVVLHVPGDEYEMVQLRWNLWASKKVKRNYLMQGKCYVTDAHNHRQTVVLATKK